MMRRTSFRLSALLLATLFLLTATKEALGLGCPHHELSPSDTAAHSLSHDLPHAHPSNWIDGESSTHYGLHDSSATAAAGNSADHQGVCTCIGNCNGTPGTPPPGAPIARFQAFESITRSLGPEPEANLPGPTPYLLPFANAPPLAH
jgi:hypothetical protein